MEQAQSMLRQTPGMEEFTVRPVRWYRGLWYFGTADQQTKTAEVNLLLPFRIKQLTLAHELSHLKRPDLEERRIITMAEEIVNAYQTHLQTLPQTASEAV